MKKLNEQTRTGFFRVLDTITHMKDAAQSFDCGMSWLKSYDCKEPRTSPELYADVVKIQKNMDELLGRLGMLIAKVGEQ